MLLVCYSPKWWMADILNLDTLSGTGFPFTGASLPAWLCGMAGLVLILKKKIRKTAEVIQHPNPNLTFAPAGVATHGNS